MRRKVLLDLVDLGLTESESKHPPYGSFALNVPTPRNDYGGQTNILPNRDLVHFREAPRTNAVTMKVPEEFIGTEIEVELSLRNYAYGPVEGPPEATIIQVMGKTDWIKLAEVDVPVDGRFYSYQFRIPAELVKSQSLMIWVDDTKSYFSNDAHYGKAIGNIRLTGDPENAGKAKRDVDLEESLAPEICLVMCPVWDILMPPVALGSLASYLEGNGVRVAVYDFNIECYHAVSEEDQKMWAGANAVSWSELEYAQEMVARFEHHIQLAADAILALGAPYVGFSVATVNAAFSMRLAEVIKERSPETKTIFGGPGIPFFQEGQLGSHWDYMIYGAGEKPLLSIVRDGDASSLGVVTIEKPEPYNPGKNRSFLTELDSLPLVHYKHFDLVKYIHPWRLPVLTSRGCINACKYCFDTVFYGPFSCMSGKRAFEQIKLLHQLHGRRMMEFSDLLCNGDLDELRIMSELLIKEGMDIEWGSFAVMRPGMTLELMKTIRAGGCKFLHYGFESGSQRMLDLMGRDYSIQDAHDSLKNTKEAGIRTKINIMVGFPGENDRTVQETIDFIKENAQYIDMVDTVNPVYVMASTDLSMNQEKYGIEVPDGVPDHWESGDLNEEKRRQWVYQIFEAVKASGVQCNYSVMRGFDCKAADEEDYH